MSSLMQRIVLQASRTFSKNIEKSQFADNFKLLTDLVNQSTASDVNFDHGFIRERDKISSHVSARFRIAPVSYIHIVENDSISIGIFILHRGSKIPLHDHPGMFGICRVIHGVGQVKSYSKHTYQNIPDFISQSLTDYQKHNSITVKQQTKSYVTPNDPPCILTPENGNYHEIKAVDGPMAFLDILSPPYDFEDGRECHYYREIDMSKTEHSSHDEHMDCVYLVDAGQPNDFWCDSRPYTGPPVTLSHLPP